MSEAYIEEPDLQFKVTEELAIINDLEEPSEEIIQAAGIVALHAVPAPEIEPARDLGKSREIEGRDSVGLYLEEIAKIPLLDAEKEVELSKRIEAGLFADHKLKADPDSLSSHEQEELEWIAQDGEEAKNHFLTANLRLVVSLARRYTRSGMPMLDLIQEGNGGLIRAVEKFDYTKGYKFSTYATWWVKQAITRGIAQQARVVRLPVHVIEEMNQVRGVNRTLERTLGREPSPAEIAQELDMEIERVIDLQSWSREHLSLDTPISDDGETTIGDLMDSGDDSESPESKVLTSDEYERLRELVSLLDEREATVIQMRFGLRDGRAYKLAVIGEEIGVSPERVRQLQKKAMETLKKLAGPAR